MSTSTTTAPSSITPDYAAIKAKQNIAWGSGDYSVVGVTLQIVGERLCEALDIRSNQTLLDVAAGNGNVSLAAARRYAKVTSSDYVPALLERGRQRAEVDGLAMEFVEADAENLPFADNSYDNVTSSFGVMFTPNQDAAAAELMRVVRPGGKIGLANWTPEGFIGQLFKTIGKHLAPPAGLKSPALWGTKERLDEFFADEAESIAIQKQTYVWRYKSAQHWLEVWREIYGPLQKAFAALDTEQQDALAADLIALIDRFNVADDGTMVVPGDYFEVVVTKRS
ncbi:class I SAM-dependent methyltransferase [Pelagicoccus mobilis]|uniref:Methyltransferase domain-containing protein n=1 Tax=Pelagicoccus mobilis TaxID=415221 RepID=A0A934VP13_9BACT|nr:methyltransferase domain-containing protein [Pelagicoccus mobilis]MBK1880521.1 methyltransferase domain-containing protein [Pelagicoccus mobilis]